MPTYEYQCGCGLLFESSAKRGDFQPKTCPSCGKMAPSKVPSQVQGHFNKTVTGPVPQNTGIQGLDAHIDRVIGQSAKQGFEVIQDRVKDKKDVLASNPGATGADLGRNPDGSYRVLAPVERKIHDRTQDIHKQGMNLVSQTWNQQRGPRRPR